MSHHLTSVEHMMFVQNHPNPFCKYGAKCYSQSDEDGFTLEIINRIQPEQKTFLELGVGDGMECNTLVLSALGWEGQWIGGQDILCKFPNFTKAWITRENVLSLVKTNPTLLSIDLDGNDYHILGEMLTILSPEIIITEHNAKFPPPVPFIMPYNPEYNWNGTDYFGASLQSFTKLLSNYKLIVCNPGTGANAFFVKNKYSKLFPEVPEDIRKIYVPPRYTVDTMHGLHQMSFETVNHVIK